MSNNDHYAVPITSGQQQQSLPDHSDVLPVASCTEPKLHAINRNSQIISCFVDNHIWLCFPEVLAKFLSDLDRFDVVTVCEHLEVNVTTCTPDQLNVLKCSQIVNQETSSCSLITLPTADRLCNFVDSSYRKLREALDLPPRLPVFHLCWGRCDGLYYRGLHVRQLSRCIRCQQCGEIMNPKYFVHHSHDTREYNNLTFDPERWPEYIHIYEGFQHDLLSRRMFNELILKFNDSTT